MSSDSVIDLSVIKVKKFEEDNRLFDSKEWTTYSLKVSGILDDFLCWLRLEKQNGRKIYGYGAAAKASTILNSIQNDENLVTAIADVSLEKQQRFMPPHGIKIISPEELITKNPTDVVIFPWNISTEIADYLRANLGDEVRLWCAIPEMRQVKV
jgi:hypothetical protein